MAIQGQIEYIDKPISTRGINKRKTITGSLQDASYFRGANSFSSASIENGTEPDDLFTNQINKIHRFFLHKKLKRVDKKIKSITMNNEVLTIDSVYRRNITSNIK